MARTFLNGVTEVRVMSMPLAVSPVIIESLTLFCFIYLFLGILPTFLPPPPLYSLCMDRPLLEGRSEKNYLEWRYSSVRVGTAVFRS